MNLLSRYFCCQPVRLFRGIPHFQRGGLSLGAAGDLSPYPCKQDQAVANVFVSVHHAQSGIVAHCGNGVIVSDGLLAVGQQHDLPEDPALAQHLVRVARLFERQPLRDQRLDLSLFEKVQ